MKIESDIEATDDREEREVRDSPWYDVPTGRFVVAGFVVLTLLAVVASTGTTTGDTNAPWSVNEPIPFDVYLYGFLGAMARSLLVFVTDVNPQTDDETLFQRSWIEMARLGFRPFGALCLAAGIHLANGALDDATVVGTALPISLLAGTAFVAGFYVERAYATLGVVADRLLSLSETDGGRVEGKAYTDSNEFEPSQSLASFVLLPAQRRSDQPRWYRDRRSQALFVTGLAITGLAVIVTIDSELLPFVPALNNEVPVDIYLYALLGSMGYVFTTLFTEFNKGVLSLLRKGVRIPAALLLAAGFHTFTFLFVAGGSPDEPTRLLAGLAFLVGLYVNVALISLDTIASRLFSRVAEKSR